MDFKFIKYFAMIISFTRGFNEVIGLIIID